MGYIFYDSDSRYLTGDELSGLSSWELKVARNEIYARHGRLFKDNELSTVYLYQKPVDITTLTLQESEVSEVIWMDFSECREKIKNKSLPNCIYLEEFDMIGEKLGILSEKIYSRRAR